ncbi:MAG: chemotaxis protein CheA [Candidatus Omnitrophica bacterium]|nr:chemotaxis protein CheA [Candidatus Omnitrophota bacterium]
MQDSYRELFLSESQEYLSNISNRLVKLESNPSDPESLNEIFRCVHTLKGMSATMGYERLTQLSHHMEDLLEELRGQKRKVTPEIMDVLFASVDVLSELVEDIKTNRESEINISAYISELEQIIHSDIPSASKAEAAFPRGKTSPVHPESIEFSEEELKAIRYAKSKGFNIFKINIRLVSDCLMKESRAFLIITNLKKIGEILKAVPPVEELEKGFFDFSFSVVLITREAQAVIRQEMMMISEVEGVYVNPVEVSAPVGPAANTPAHAYIKKIQSLRIPIERLDKIMNLIGELAIARIRLSQIVANIKEESLEEASVLLSSLISALQDEIMQTRLLPVAYILDTFPRMVRDMAKKEEKRIDLEIVGSDIELDRVILDEIGDPLVHLIRNSIDHGIESPQERKAVGKPPAGKLQILVSRQKGQISIEISDDGRGVEFDAVKNIALRKGLITQEEADGLDDKKVLDLISLPGFSTSEKITDISGRGVGLDAVKSKIESIGGRLDFTTNLGKGSTFILSLPFTLAIIKAMLVRVGKEVFAVPLINIRETIKVEKHDIKVLQNLEVIRVREEIIPVLRLDKEFVITISPEDKNRNALGEINSNQEDGRVPIVIVEFGKHSLGLVVSQVIGEQDIVVKPLTSLIKRTRGIAGATILGDGKVALILDIMSLK